MQITTLQLVVLGSAIAGAIWQIVEAYLRHCKETGEKFSWGKAASAIFGGLAVIAGAAKAVQLPAADVQLELPGILMAAFSAFSAAHMGGGIGNMVKNTIRKALR